ncbi:MAG: molecular chaperone GrpE [Miltoncostaeaceae bacterium]|jgi:molecular chaperone GrpE|nr:molecular chaperone GrpE [Miltoncostaeaceae bacterium]
MEQRGPETGAGGPSAGADAGTEQTAQDDAAVARQELERRLAATEDRLLRALADLDNQRKRVARDLERGRLDTHERVLRDWLEVIDSGERALAAYADRAQDPIFSGLAALVGQMEDVLRRQSVQRLGTPGETFDPERHEAVGTAPAGGVPENSVVAVARPGYAMNGRLLRPAQVIVARGGGDGA